MKDAFKPLKCTLDIKQITKPFKGKQNITFYIFRPTKLKRGGWTKHTVTALRSESKTIGTFTINIQKDDTCLQRTQSHDSHHL